MRKGFVVRDRSLSSLPSRQLSINQFMAQKSVALQTYRTKAFQQSKILSQKQEDIFKLKTNLDHALKMAVNQAIQSTKAKQQSMRSTQSKMHIEKKYLQVTEQLNQEKINRMKVEGALAGLQYQLNKQQEQKRRIRQMQEQTSKQFDKAKKQLSKVPELESKITQIDPLKSRIKTLQANMRQQKLLNQEMRQENKKLQNRIEELKQKIKQTKPYQQQLLQKIALLQRVNLELQRKMQDFHRREHQYKKEVLHYKTALAKMTTDRNKYKSDYEQTYGILQQKISFIGQLESTIADKNTQIASLSSQLQEKTQQSLNFSQKLEQTIAYYKGVAQQNEIIKKKITLLQKNQQEMRRVLASHTKVAEETNLYIVSRNSQILKLEEQKRNLIQNLDQLQKKFIKLDRLFDENSARGSNQIKQSYAGTIKERNKFALQIKQVKEELASKILQFGEERDTFNRKIEAYNVPIPNDSNLYQSVIADKVQMILMLESSNDQLLKVKKQQEDRIRQFECELELAKKQMYNLRLKAAELFKCKKDLEDSRARAERYQQMIEEQKSQIVDLNSQLDILRMKNSEIGQKNYTMSMQNKNLSFKLTQFENVMKELDVQYLNAKKTQNQKNAHVITDSLEKLQNGINSLAYYFSCCFCGQLLNNPVTLAVCGHNYCTKCKDAYSEYCYECDTGQEIERIYSSKYLKETAGKYRFLVMVLKQTQSNMIKINF